MGERIKYWAGVFRRAAANTRQTARWDSVVRVVWSLAPTAASGFVTWGVTGEPGWGAVASVATLVALAALAFIAHLIAAPVAIDGEVRAELAKALQRIEARKRIEADHESERRAKVMRKLSALYYTETDGKASDVWYELALPPEDWINEKLAEYGEPWSVFDVRGMDYQTFEIVGPVPSPAGEPIPSSAEGR